MPIRSFSSHDQILCRLTLKINPSQRPNTSFFFSTFLILFVSQCNSEFPINGKYENDKMYPYDLSNLNVHFITVTQLFNTCWYPRKTNLVNHNNHDT